MSQFPAFPPRDDVVYLRTVDRSDALAEHSLVRLSAPVTTDSGITILKGAVGTIVAVLADGAAYEVELTEPTPAVVTVEAGYLTPYSP